MICCISDQTDRDVLGISAEPQRPIRDAVMTLEDIKQRWEQTKIAQHSTHANNSDDSEVIPLFLKMADIPDSLEKLEDQQEWKDLCESMLRPLRDTVSPSVSRFSDDHRQIESVPISKP
jgi:hypothetical protein